MKPCLCAGKDRQSSFRHCGSPVKLVYACLCAGKDRESSFHLCAGAVKHYRPVYAPGKIDKLVSVTVEVV